LYKKYNELIRTGDYYRISSYRTNHFYDCFQVVSKEKEEALVTYIQVLNRPNCHSSRIYLKGLNPNKNYKIEGEDRIYGGDTLMFAGLNLTKIAGDFKGYLIHLTAI
jgi:alpha-galactosidase